MKIVALGIALFFVVSAQSQLKDTIYFNNGTIVVGKLLKIKLGIVTFDPDDANDITVQSRKLKTISGKRKIFRIETIKSKLYYGTILKHPDPNFIYVYSGLDSISVNLEEISVLYPFDNRISERFSGNVSVGYTYTKSSGFGRLNFDGTVKYVSRKEELSLSASGIYSIYDSLFSRDNESINIKYNYFFTKTWFATVFLVYQRNLELGLQRRYQEGLGIGNKFITSRHMYAWARTGAVINQEKSTEGEISPVLTELFGQLEFNVFKFDHPKINFTMTNSFYYSLTQAGRIRNDGSIGMTWEIFKDFKLSIEPYSNFDNQPPVEGNDKFDFGIVFGIKYIFW